MRSIFANELCLSSLFDQVAAREAAKGECKAATSVPLGGAMTQAELQAAVTQCSTLLELCQQLELKAEALMYVYFAVIS